MNALPSIFLPASEEADLIVSEWQRLHLKAATPEAIDDIETPEPPVPYVLSPEQERAEYEAEIEDQQRQYGEEE